MAYTDIDKPSDYFNTKIYTGNGTTDTSITGVGFQPDMSWFKGRTNTENHFLFDSIRGATVRLIPNGTSSDLTAAQSMKSFDSDGFTLGSDADVNQNSINFVSWNWKEQAGVFDVVSYTGNATSGATISHNLGVVPTMMIVKCRSVAGTNWIVYTAATGNTHWMYLNATNAAGANSAAWNNTSPTASQFSLGNDGDVNGNGRTYIAYLFGNKQGMSKTGSYEGNGNANGTFVYTGFSVGWVMIKNIDTGSTAWVIQDSKRSSSSGGNPADKRLRANANNAEETDSPVDLLSNGFKIRSTGSFTSDANTFIYMAFAENPFVTSTGVPATAR